MILTQSFKTHREVTELFNERDNNIEITNHPSAFCMVLGNKVCNGYSNSLKNIFDHRAEFFMNFKAVHAFSLWDAGMMFLAYDAPYFFKLENRWGRSEICHILQYAVNHIETNTLDIMIIFCNKLTKEIVRKHDSYLDILNYLGKPKDKEKFDDLMNFACFGVRLYGNDMVIYDTDSIKEAAINYFNSRYKEKGVIYCSRELELEINKNPLANICKQDDDILMGGDFVKLILRDDDIVICYNLNLKGADKKAEFVANLLWILQYGDVGHYSTGKVLLSSLLKLRKIDRDMGILKELKKHSAFNITTGGKLIYLQTSALIHSENVRGSYAEELGQFMLHLKTGNYVRARDNCFISSSYLNTFSAGNTKESYYFVHTI